MLPASRIVEQNDRVAEMVMALFAEMHSLTEQVI
jgi:hypothetical protein